jgi:hypothetical protein
MLPLDAASIDLLAQFDASDTFKNIAKMTPNREIWSPEGKAQFLG